VYAEIKLKNKYNKTGDVSARTHIRYVEIGQSINIINWLMAGLEKDSCSGTILCETKNNLKPESFVISIVEGWRGEIVHTMLTDESGQLIKYKIKDPSFNNWFMLALSVRNNGISDFPLCNKSFNLSYCGNDL
jgi:Ni,Fe-hydrogenase III large subunit